MAATNECGKPIDGGRRANVGMAERIVSAVAGGALLIAGASRRSVGGAAMTILGVPLAYRGVTGHCPMYHALGVRGEDAQPASHPFNREIHGSMAHTVDRPADDVYRFWRHFENLAATMDQIESVVPLDDHRARWLVRSPTGGKLRFDTVLVEDKPGELITWRTEGDSDIRHRGQVEFCESENGRSTTVRVSYWYQPPLGVVGDLVARLMGRHCNSQTRQGLQRIKHTLEASEIATPADSFEPAHAPAIDRVEEGSEESFPASDAPSYTPGRV